MTSLAWNPTGLSGLDVAKNTKTYLATFNCIVCSIYSPGSSRDRGLLSLSPAGFFSDFRVPKFETEPDAVAPGTSTTPTFNCVRCHRAFLEEDDGVADWSSNLPIF